ncbi:MAG: L,D-transpeptidase family protein [Myxococcota bacterium]
MWWTISALAASPIPADTTQLVLVVAADPDRSEATVTRWTRAEAGWTLEGPPVAARIGARGVAWGRGLHPPQPGLQKVEGDQRAPAGVFALGDAWGDAPVSPARWPYHPVGPRDLWYEDPASPLYNTHVRVPGTEPLTPDQQRAVMRSGDPAHALKVFVAHNAPPDAVPGAGSAIFLHTWRKDGVAPTAGCTAMERADLDVLVGWLDPARHPALVLLTIPELERLDEAWDLPTPPR